MPKSLLTGWFKWFDLPKFNLDKYDDNSSRDCVLKVDLEYPKKLNKSQNNYHSAPDKTKIKAEKFPDYKVKITDDYNISIGNVKN